MKLRYRLSTLFLLVTVICIFLAYRWHNCERYYAFESLASDGAIMYCKGEVTREWRRIHRERPSPTLFDRTFGFDPRSEAVVVDLRDAQIDQSTIVNISRIPTVELVNLAGVDVSRCNFGTLKNSHVRFLILAHCALSKDTLKEVYSLKSLESLNLADTVINEADLREFASHPSLKYVNLFGSSVSDEVVNSLAESGKEVDLIDR
jgi:hypothetical protein